MLCNLPAPVLSGAGAPPDWDALCQLDHARGCFSRGRSLVSTSDDAVLQSRRQHGGCVSRTGAIVGASYRIELTETQTSAAESLDRLVTCCDTSSLWGTSVARCDVRNIKESLFAVQPTVARGVAVRCLETGPKRPWPMRTLCGTLPPAAVPAAAWARCSGRARRLVRRHARDANGVSFVGEPYGSTPRDTTLVVFCAISVTPAVGDSGVRNLPRTSMRP
jgi:hypothetical protein